MTQPPHRRATYEDLLAVPDTMVAEIVDGELHVGPRPALPHTHAHTYLLGGLVGAFERSGSGPPTGGGWWFMTEPELHLGDDVLVPDIAAWRRTRMPTVPNAAFLTLRPDWLCEIVSPSTARLDRAMKLPVYAREGVPNLWLVDPLARTLESYRLEDGRWLLLATFAGDTIVRCEPFEEVELAMGRWWLREEASRSGATP